eukprot:14419375-Alexandrium_andersonii.AAC.1
MGIPRNECLERAGDPLKPAQNEHLCRLRRTPSRPCGQCLGKLSSGQLDWLGVDADPQTLSQA